MKCGSQSPAHLNVKATCELEDGHEDAHRYERWMWPKSPELHLLERLERLMMAESSQVDRSPYQLPGESPFDALKRMKEALDALAVSPGKQAHSLDLDEAVLLGAILRKNSDETLLECAKRRMATYDQALDQLVVKGEIVDAIKGALECPIAELPDVVRALKERADADEKTLDEIAKGLGVERKRFSADDVLRHDRKYVAKIDQLKKQLTWVTNVAREALEPFADPRPGTAEQIDDAEARRHAHNVYEWLAHTSTPTPAQYVETNALAWSPRDLLVNLSALLKCTSDPKVVYDHITEKLINFSLTREALLTDAPDSKMTTWQIDLRHEMLRAQDSILGSRAEHRMQERMLIADWLRSLGPHDVRKDETAGRDLADAIDRGEHAKGRMFGGDRFPDEGTVAWHSDSLGRALYIGETFVGVVDSVQLAAKIVDTMNGTSRGSSIRDTQLVVTLQKFTALLGVDENSASVLEDLLSKTRDLVGDGAALDAVAHALNMPGAVAAEIVARVTDLVERVKPVRWTDDERAILAIVKDALKPFAEASYVDENEVADADHAQRVLEWLEDTSKPAPKRATVPADIGEKSCESISAAGKRCQLVHAHTGQHFHEYNEPNASGVSRWRDRSSVGTTKEHEGVMAAFDQDPPIEVHDPTLPPSQEPIEECTATHPTHGKCDDQRAHADPRHRTGSIRWRDAAAPERCDVVNATFGPCVLVRAHAGLHQSLPIGPFGSAPADWRDEKSVRVVEKSTITLDRADLIHDGALLPPFKSRCGAEFPKPIILASKPEYTTCPACLKIRAFPFTENPSPSVKTDPPKADLPLPKASAPLTPPSPVQAPFRSLRYVGHRLGKSDVVFYAPNLGEAQDKGRALGCDEVSQNGYVDGDGIEHIPAEETSRIISSMVDRAPRETRK